MSNSKILRPVVVCHNGKYLNGFFHRFVYSYSSYHSFTQALIELDDGRLRYFDPFFVRFTDRDSSKIKGTKEKNLSKPQN